MNIAAIAIIAVLITGLLVLFFIRNQKDKKELEEQIKSDYRKTKDEEKDIDAEPKLK